MCRPGILLERFPELPPAFPNPALKRQVFKCEECKCARALRYLAVLDDLLHTLMSGLWLVEICPIFGCTYGKKTESTNGVDRIIGICSINKLRKTSSLPTSHTNLPTHGRRLDLRTEEVNEQSHMHPCPNWGKGEKKRPP